MKLIDRLLFSVTPRAERLIMAFVTFDDASGLYVADCHLWAGSGERSVISEHKTERGAFRAVDRVADQYPNRKKIPVFYGDYDLL